MTVKDICLQWSTGGWFGLVIHWFANQKIIANYGNWTENSSLWPLAFPLLFFSPLSNILHFYSSNWTWKVSGNWCTKSAVVWFRLSSKSGFSLALERWHSLLQMIKANLLLRLELNIVHLKVVCMQSVAWNVEKVDVYEIILKETKHSHVINTLRKGIKAM